jgi:hypothetical protein
MAARRKDGNPVMPRMLDNIDERQVKRRRVLGDKMLEIPVAKEDTIFLSTFDIGIETHLGSCSLETFQVPGAVCHPPPFLWCLTVAVMRPGTNNRYNIIIITILSLAFRV